VFRDEQIAAIIALSCEDPEVLGLPFSHWTPELLQIEAIKGGIIESISVRHVGRILKRKRFTAESC
jgi:putative transposase